jgi:hypothetical protein
MRRLPAAISASSFWVLVMFTLIICSLLGTVGEIETTVDNLAAHDHSQRKTILSKLGSHLCVTTLLDALVHFVYSCFLT